MKVINENDPEPVFGLAASLPDPEFKLVQTKTRDWFAETVEFVDMAYIARGPLLCLLDDHWPADPEHQNHDPALAAPDARSYVRPLLHWAIASNGPSETCVAVAPLLEAKVTGVHAIAKPDPAPSSLSRGSPRWQQS